KVADLPFLSKKKMELPSWAAKTTLAFSLIKAADSDLQFLKDWKINAETILIPKNLTKPDALSIQVEEKLLLKNIHLLTMGVKWYTQTLSNHVKESNKNTTSPNEFFSRKSGETNERREWLQNSDCKQLCKNGALRIHVELDDTVNAEELHVE